MRNKALSITVSILCLIYALDIFYLNLGIYHINQAQFYACTINKYILIAPLFVSSRLTNIIAQDCLLSELTQNTLHIVSLLLRLEMIFYAAVAGVIWNIKVSWQTITTNISNKGGLAKFIYWQASLFVLLAGIALVSLIDLTHLNDSGDLVHSSFFNTYMSLFVIGIASAFALNIAGISAVYLFNYYLMRYKNL
jgi:hypothetical protein